MGDEGDSATMTIAPSGDLVLLVGDPVEVKLLVSSAVLQDASKVFAALLGPHFLEGQPTQGGPKEIELPEDDAVGMSDMCHLLHNKQVHGLLKNRPSSGRILAFAIMVDKYDCVDALQLQIQGILLGFLLQEPKPYPECFAKQMLAAYLLRHAQTFGLASSCLINRTTYPCSAFLKFDWSKRMPLSWIYALSEQRARATNEVIFELPSLAECDCGCSRSDPNFVELLCKAFGVSHWPPDLRSDGTCTILDAVEIISNLGTINLREICAHVQRNEITSEELKEFAEQLGLLCRGLCLQCAIADEVIPREICEDPSHR